MHAPPEVTAEIRNRHDAIKAELVEVAPYAFTDGRHLDANTPERAYWHLGYIAALSDVLRLLSGEVSQRPGSRDMSS